MGTKLILVISVILLISTGLCFKHQNVTNILGVKVKKGKGRVFDKDYRLWLESDQYSNLKGSILFGSITTGKRNDTLFITSAKKLYKDSLVLTEYHHYKLMDTDSIRRTIVKRNNTLVLKYYREFSNGKVVRESRY